MEGIKAYEYNNASITKLDHDLPSQQGRVRRLRSVFDRYHSNVCCPTRVRVLC